MKINYDKIADAAYFKLAQGKIDHTKKVDASMLVDMDKNGNIIGIELLDYSANKSRLNDLKNSVERGVPVSIVNATPVLS